MTTQVLSFTPGNSKGARINRLIEDHSSYVEVVARTVASSMPVHVEFDDLVQNGMLGLIEAARRFDESKGIKFRTFSLARIRGAMIDALRKNSWPRQLRRQRSLLQEARQALRQELGCEPSAAELSARANIKESRLLQILTVESTSPFDRKHFRLRPPILTPSQPESPDQTVERREAEQQLRSLVRQLPWRELRIVYRHYYGDQTFEQIAHELGVSESRVSQLHAQAVRWLREALSHN